MQRVDERETFSGYAELVTHWRKSNEASVRVGNRVLLRHGQGVAEQYREDLKLFYDCDVEEKTFARDSADIIRAWVAAVTNNMIPSILDSLQLDTRFLLLNAVYFKGQWKKAFDPLYTRSLIFCNNGNQPVKVSMMCASLWCNRSSFKIANVEFDVCELPYRETSVLPSFFPRRQPFSAATQRSTSKLSRRGSRPLAAKKRTFRCQK